MLHCYRGAFGPWAAFSRRRAMPMSRTVLLSLLAIPASALRDSDGSARPYRLQRASPVTKALLAANVASFAVVQRRQRLFLALAKSNAALARGQYYRLASSCLLHANAAHLFVNSASLHNIGPVVEAHFGSTRFAALYAASGVCGNVLSWSLGRAPLSVGASGAIFGLLGGWAVFLASNQRVLEARGARNIGESLSSLATTCALNAALGLSPGSRLDNFGHAGGALGGIAFGALCGPRLREAWVPLRAGGPGLALVDQPLLRLPGRQPSGRRRGTPVGRQRRRA